MSDKKFTLKDFIKKKKTTITSPKPKKKKGGLADQWFTTGTGGDASGVGTGGGTMGESLLSELFQGMGGSMPAATKPHHSAQLGKTSNSKDAGMTTYPSEEDDYEEEQEAAAAPTHHGATKVEQARRLFQGMIDLPNVSRGDIIDRFKDEVGVTDSTAVSYYTRFMKETGRSADDETPFAAGADMRGETEPGVAPTGDEELTPPVEEPPEMEEFPDPNRAGIIRTVDNAHLVYKRQSEDGTFEELWIYNIHDTTNDDLDIRRDVLAGTDIPVKKTRSPDGSQSYEITTMGNAQMLKVKGLPN